MSLQSLAVLLVALVGCTSLLALGQEVSVRSGSDDDGGLAESDAAVEASSQGRNVYSGKLHPHRMMHFGKRPDPISGQLYEQQPPQQSQPSLMTPYTYYYPLPRQRVAESAQPESINLRLRPDSYDASRDRLMRNAYQEILNLQQVACDEKAINALRQQQQQQQLPTWRQSAKMMRLLGPSAAELSGSTSDSSSSSSSSNSSNNNNNDQQQQQPDKKSDRGQMEQHDASGTTNGRAADDEIDRSSRSIGRPMPGLTRAQVSMLLGGSAGSGQSLLNFIKKAEPQRMTFMHFGRRR